MSKVESQPQPNTFYDNCVKANYTEEYCKKAQGTKDNTPIFVNIFSIGLVVLFACLIVAMIYRYCSKAKRVARISNSADDISEQMEVNRSQNIH